MLAERRAAVLGRMVSDRVRHTDAHAERRWQLDRTPLHHRPHILHCRGAAHAAGLESAAADVGFMIRTPVIFRCLLAILIALAEGGCAQRDEPRTESPTALAVGV